MTVNEEDEAVEKWKQFDWESLQTRVEGEIKAMEVRAVEAEEGKQRLLEESNKYRSSTDKEQRKAALPLIKAFQKEVDECRERERALSATVVGIFGKLVDLPDLRSTLSQLADLRRLASRTAIAEEEAAAAKQEIANITVEFAGLKNQDVTIRQLREKVKEAESEKMSAIESILAETERAMQEKLAARDAEASVASDRSRSEIGNLERKVAELEARMREQTRRLDGARTAADHKETIESEHIEEMTRETGDLRRKLRQAETEIAQLNAELVEARTAATRGNALEDIAVLGSLMKEKDEQIAKLLDEKTRIVQKAHADARAVDQKMRNMQGELSRQRELIIHMQAELTAKSDYEVLKQELRALRELELGPEAAAALEENTPETTVGEALKRLDKLMSDKNRRLQSDNAHLRKTKEEVVVPPPVAEIPDSLQPMVQAIGRMVSGDFPEGDFDEQGTPPEEADPEAAQNLFTLLLQSMNVPAEEEKKEVKPSSSNKKKPSPPSDNGPRTPFVHGIEVRPLPGTESSSPSISNSASLGGKAEPTAAEMKIIKELQARVAANIRGLGMTALNTAEIAGQCKKLMVAYNIGQRLFAKFVMNQSQGSLSELLSKPRHWAKLTDKGREAFRRIYGWISDSTAIELLCSLSPRRIHPGEVKVDHPTPESLWECNTGNNLILSNENTTDLKEDRRAVSAKEDQYRSSGSYSGATAKGNSRWRHDDIPKEKITEIFETELAKLREQESHLERAINARTSSSNGNVTGSSLKKLEALSDGNGDLPIQVNHAQQVMTLKIRSGLTPVTPEQFDMFPYVDTEELVRQIKDFLQANSISQRQFGEFVLGLSQGSVSDLLARPKAWELMTLKGREPFVRMQLFMRDVEAAVEKDKRDKARKESSHARYSREPPITNGTSVGPISDETSESTPEILPLFVSGKVKIEPEEEVSDHVVPPVPKKSPEEMDTATLVRKVKERLYLNSISQRDFGEHVLNMSSGSTSDIFLRPKKWNQLTSARTREPYEKMKNWLMDKHAIAFLVDRMRENDAPSTIAPPPPPVSESSNGRPLKRPAPFDPSSFENSNGNMGPPRKVSKIRPPMPASAVVATRSSMRRAGSVMPQSKTRPPQSPLPPTPSKMERASSIATSMQTPPTKTSTFRKPVVQTPVLKTRTVITDQQKEALKFVFAHEQHPSQATIEQLSVKLSMNIRTVQNWFHNYRTRQKASLKEAKIAGMEMFGGGSDDWQKALEAMLDHASKNILAEESAPTMVASLKKEESSTPTPSIKTEPNGSVPPSSTTKRTSSQLDKAVERMRLLAGANS